MTVSERDHQQHATEGGSDSGSTRALGPSSHLDLSNLGIIIDQTTEDTSLFVDVFKNKGLKLEDTARKSPYVLPTICKCIRTSKGHTRDSQMEQQMPTTLQFTYKAITPCLESRNSQVLRLPITTTQLSQSNKLPTWDYHLCYSSSLVYLVERDDVDI